MARQFSNPAAFALLGIGLIAVGTSWFEGGERAAMASVQTRAQQAASPTVVWYGFEIDHNGVRANLHRAWSDGTIELKRILFNGGTICSTNPLACTSPWVPLSAPTDGNAAAADLNEDRIVNGVDLATVLGAWGPSPRAMVPASTCALNLLDAGLPKAQLSGPDATIVWYAVSTSNGVHYQYLCRAWSDGRVELKAVDDYLRNCNSTPATCQSPWITISDSSEGMALSPDINSDEQVDAADLAIVLGSWGAAPPYQTSTSNCPLELVLP